MTDESEVQPPENLAIIDKRQVKLFLVVSEQKLKIVTSGPKQD